MSEFVIFIEFLTTLYSFPPFLSWSLWEKSDLSCFWQHCMFLSPFLIAFKLHQTLQFFLSSPLMNPAYAVPGTQAQESWRMLVFTNSDGQIRVEEQKNHHQVMKHNFLFYFPDIFPRGQSLHRPDMFCRFGLQFHVPNLIPNELALNFSGCEDLWAPCMVFGVPRPRIVPPNSSLNYGLGLHSRAYSFLWCRADFSWFWVLISADITWTEIRWYPRISRDFLNGVNWFIEKESIKTKDQF